MFSLNRYWIFLGIIVLAYAAFEYYRPKPLDWTSTYSNKDNIPFGAEAIYQLLPDLIGNRKVTSLRIPPYNHLHEDSLLPSRSSYMFINNECLIDDNDQKALLDYVKKGNTVFISAYDFPDSLMKVLGVKAILDAPSKTDTAKYVNFVNPRLREEKGLLFPKDDGRNHLKIINFEKNILLASNEENEPVFVQSAYGKGRVYLHNLPLAFTNYFIVDTVTNKHAFKALSYLPEQPVFWDEYQKQGRFGEEEGSVFRYIVSQPGLKNAYYLGLILLLLFAIFYGKRRQRVIPVINPPKNVSLEFVTTIGNMYYRKGDHANIAEKLKHHFWIYVRERFGITTSQMKETDLFSILAQKSGFSESEMQLLQEEIADQHGKWTADRLKDLNSRLEDFYERTR